MKKHIQNLLFFMMLLACHALQAQSARKLIHEGNKLYEQKKYNEAEINYRKSMAYKETPFVGNYNLGNTFYQEGKYDEAIQQYQSAASQKSLSETEKAMTFHNMGNALLKTKKYEQSIEAYKQALKVNPKDNDTRYNLAYAQSMLQQQQQQQKNNDDKNKNDKNKNQDQKNKDQQKKDQQKQQQEKQEQQDQEKEQQKQQEQAKKDKISKEDAEKILQALNNDEKKTQKKLNVKQPTKVQIEKEW